MILNLSPYHQQLPADTLWEQGSWLLGAILPTRPHVPRGTSTSSARSPSPSEGCQGLWA